MIDALVRMLDATTGPNEEQSTTGGGLLHSPADEAAQERIRAMTSLQPLSMYLATWMMEPDLTAEILTATNYLFDTQFPPTTSVK